MRSSLSVTGSILPLLLSVMAIRYSPNNSMNREPSSRPFTAPRIRTKTSGDRQQSAFFFFPTCRKLERNRGFLAAPSRNPKIIHRPGQPSLALSEPIEADERRKFG